MRCGLELELTRFANLVQGDTKWPNLIQHFCIAPAVNHDPVEKDHDKKV
jgi:hypothetical protein